MKFSTPFYTLLVASATFANVIPQKREMPNISIQNIQSSCTSKLFEENKECVFGLEDLSTLEQKCASYKSEKCQKFFIDLSSSIAACTEVTDDKRKDLDEIIDKTKKYFDVICTTDENNKLCPIVTSIATMGEEEVYSKAINDSCKSKVCTDAGYSFLENNLGTSGLADYKDTKFDKAFNVRDANPHGDSDFYAMAYLKSDYCVAQQQKTEGATASQPQKTEGGADASKQQNAQSSDATTLNYSIMITLITLCFTLF